MQNIVTFIGWHNSGKTTLAVQVVKHLKNSGYRVAVIKSSKTTDIQFDTPSTDTYKHRQAGADSVLFTAPDQMVLITDNQNLSLATLASHYFPDVDIIIGEGFKNAESVAKIEVVRDPEQLLSKRVSGIIAIATDHDINGDHIIFRLNESAEIASFIEKRFLLNRQNITEKATLCINGKKMLLPKSAQHFLVDTVIGYVQSLNLSEKKDKIELHITIDHLGPVQE
jgi:molybdopterin-guanine dinucleotide biosynthesis protein B